MTMTCDAAGEKGTCDAAIEIEGNESVIQNYRDAGPTDDAFLGRVQAKGWSFGWGLFFCPECVMQICEDPSTKTHEFLV